MALRFIYGKSNSGKSEYCIREAIASGKRAMIIVPEQYSFTAEKALAEKLGVSGMGGIEIHSFARLAQQELKTLSGAALPHIDRGGKIMLLYKIIHDNSKTLKLLSENESDKAEQMLALISEFKRYNISVEALESLADTVSNTGLQLKLKETAFVYKRFEEKIADRFTDSDDNLMRLAKCLDKEGALEGVHIYIDGFSSFTESELALADVFLRHAEMVTVTLCMERKDRGRLEFLPCEQTEKKLYKMASEAGVHICPHQEMEYVPPQNTDIAHLLSEYFNYPHKTFDNDVNSIELFEAKNPYTETLYVASQITKLCRENGYKFRDIGIVCSDMPLYSKYIKTVFRQFDIPVFPDSKVGVLNHGIVVFVLSALEAITSGYIYEPIFRYARSGFLSIDRESLDALENYILATGIRGDVWKKADKWDYRFSVYAEREELSAEEKETLDIINNAKAVVAEPLLRLDSELCSSRKVSGKCAALYNFIINMELDKKAEALATEFENAGDSYRAIEYRSVFNKVIDALDDMVGSVGDDAVSNAAFYEILKTGLAQYEIGLVPALQDGVLSGDISRIKGYDVKAMFIIGAVDASFPAPIKPNGFLSDSDRTAIGQEGVMLAPVSFAQAAENEHLIYKAISSPSEKLIITFPSSDFDGGAMRPAAIVSRIKDIFPSLKMQSDVLEKDDVFGLLSPYSVFECLADALSAGLPLNEDYTAAYEYFMSSPKWKKKLESRIKSIGYRNVARPLSDKTLERSVSGTLKTAVSRLERFRKCPFSYFMQYTLNAKERPEMKLHYNEAGSFLHNFVDEFSKRLEANGMSWADATDGYIMEEADKILGAFDKRLNTYIISKSPRMARLFVRLKETACASLKLIREHITRGRFKPLGYEISFDENGKFKPLKIALPNGTTVSLRGRIDRADALNLGGNTFVRIIDYKSGSKSFDLGDFFYGINLQLAVYITALCENKNMLPAGMLYFRLDNPPVKSEPQKLPEEVFDAKLKSGELKLNGLILNDDEVWQAMDTEKESFDFLPARRKNSKSFASAEDFAALRKYVTKTVSDIAEEILSGDTSIAPYKSGDYTPCSGCSFKSVCAFDASVGCSYRRLPSDIDFWEEIRGEL